MAALFDRSNPASPLAYDASQTALLLLDFQGFCINACATDGKAALAKGKKMREWATAHQVLVVHSIVDVTSRPPATYKGAERIEKLLDGIASDERLAEEPPEIAFAKREREYRVLKHAGTVSALKSTEMMELLRKHGIRSLMLCGISTSGAILRTAVPATDDGFIVSVIQDACCDPVDGLHDTLIKTVLPSKAHVATAEVFMKEWAKED